MTAKEQREARLAAQLRENLKRRKAAARESINSAPGPNEEERDPGSSPG